MWENQDLQRCIEMRLYSVFEVKNWGVTLTRSGYLE